MENVNLSEMQVLEKIQAKIVLLTGSKISLQEILDKCILYSNTHFEAFVMEEFDFQKLTEEKINLILSTTLKSGYHFPEKSDDELIYDL